MQNKCKCLLGNLTLGCLGATASIRHIQTQPDIICTAYAMDTVHKLIIEFLQEFPDYVDLFNVSFRQQCATAPVGEMLSGNLTHDTIHTSIQLALQQTAAAMHVAARQNPDTSEPLAIAAHQLSSPLLARMIEVASQSLQRGLAPTSLPARRVRDDTQSSKPRSPVAVPARANVIPPQQEKTRVDPLAVRSAILASFNDIPVIFAGCPKLRCQTPQCDTCRSVFQKLNLSKCAGHAQCHPTGWYVHLSPALVHGLNKVHAGAEPLRLQYRAPAKGELGSPWEQPLSWAEDMDRPQSPTYPPPAQTSARGRGRGSAHRGSSRPQAGPSTPSRTRHNRAVKRARPNPPEEALRSMRIGSPEVPDRSRTH